MAALQAHALKVEFRDFSKSMSYTAQTFSEKEKKK